MKEVGLYPGTTNNATTGFDMVNLSEAVFSRISVSHTGSNAFNIGLKCNGCCINYFDNWTITQATGQLPSKTGMYFSGGSANFIRNANLFALKLGIKFDGGGTHNVIRDGWLEALQYPITFDDSAGPGSAVNYDGTYIKNTRFLLNGAGQPGLVYPSQTALFFQNSNARQMLISNLHFEENTVYCASGLCSSAYPIRYCFGTWNDSSQTCSTGASPAGSSLSLWISKNDFIGATGGIMTGNPTGSNSIAARGLDNYSADSNFVTLPNDFNFPANNGVGAVVHNLTGGTVTLPTGGGTTTATVNLIGFSNPGVPASANNCVCTDQNSTPTAVSCSVPPTPPTGVLTITGTAAHTISYFCF